MTTQTIKFPAPPTTLDAVRIVLIDDDTSFVDADTITPMTEGGGLFEATFTDAPAGDYSIHVDVGGTWLFADTVVGVTTTTARFLSTFLRPGVLAPTGLDAISAAVPNGVATTFPQRMMQVWGRFFYRCFWDKANGLIKTYRADGTTVNTQQTATTSNTTGDDVGNAS
jgi:hypothetical protein